MAEEDRAAKVRNEGIENMHGPEVEKGQDIDLEIEDPGAANKVAEEGSLTLQSEAEFTQMAQKLDLDRKKPEYQIGEGGFQIELKNPNEFSDTMRILVLHDSKTPISEVKMEKFETKDNTQSQTAAMAMQMTLETALGATIIDDGQKGRESLIQNMASDDSKTTSQMISGYSIRQGFVQKMAPGDKKFHIVTYENKMNKMSSHLTR